HFAHDGIARILTILKATAGQSPAVHVIASPVGEQQSTASFNDSVRSNSQVHTSSLLSGSCALTHPRNHRSVRSYATLRTGSDERNTSCMAPSMRSIVTERPR